MVALAGCAADRRADDRGAGASSGATTEPSNQQMKGSADIAPGAEGERRAPGTTTAPASKY
jgi:hypothetical protein